jgi:hypothetical protein
MLTTPKLLRLEITANERYPPKQEQNDRHGNNKIKTKTIPKAQQQQQTTPIRSFILDDIIFPYFIVCDFCQD